MKILLIGIFFLVHMVAHSQTYNGPVDKKYFRQPKDLICNGLPSYPKGANLTFPRDSYVGNLLDGFNIAYTAGKVGIIYFEDMKSNDGKNINGFAAEIDVSSNFLLKYKDLPIKCSVKNWY